MQNAKRGANGVIAGCTLLLALFPLSGCAQTGASEPIIDAHYHAAWPDGDDAAELAAHLAEMDAHGVVLSLLFANDADDIANWKNAAPGRFRIGPSFPCVVRNNAGGASCDWNGAAWPEITWLRDRYQNGDFHVMGEMLFVYAGISPDDPRMEPYWALAEELKIPVGVHINRGPPQGAPPRVEGCCPDFNSDLGDPSLLEPVLKRHPDLRIWLQHAGVPGIPPTDNIDYTEETIGILQRHPNVYVDFSVLNSLFDEAAHEAALRRFIEAGVADRIMFGSDNMPVGPIITRLESFDFLTAEQRRGIFYDNAARFLCLDEALIATHKSGK